MSIAVERIKLFKEGDEFNQIHFLDNFYINIPIDVESGEDIANLLSAAISDSTSIYVKRSAFKIFCDLSLLKKIPNRFQSLGILQNFLSTEESTLQEIALKYLPHFKEAHTDEIQEILKNLSDNSNGDVASQAYLCLGLMQLITNMSEPSSPKLILSLAQVRPYFEVASQATENRVDADFYLLLIDWANALLSNDPILALSKYVELEKNLQFRCLYEFVETGLEMDFLIFQLTKSIKTNFDNARSSMEWLVIKPRIEALFIASLEINKLQNIDSTNQGLIKAIVESTFNVIESSVYSMHLTSEEQRLQALKLESEDSQLTAFIEYLLSTFPKRQGGKPENMKLLAILSEHLGSEDGLRIYEYAKDKDISAEKVLSDLLLKNGSNKLSIRTGSIHGHEVITSLISQIEQALPEYSFEKRQAFFNILEEVIRYVRATLTGNEKARFLYLFSESENGKGQSAIEQDLQNSLYNYLEHSKIADGLDHEKAKFVDGGRVDILYKKDLITIPIELKKSLSRPSKETLENNYIAQAQTYTSGYDQLGIFVLLELSDKTKEPPPNFKDWFRLHHLEPSSNLETKYPDYVVSIIIPGNRTTPSAKSTYK